MSKKVMIILLIGISMLILIIAIKQQKSMQSNENTIVSVVETSEIIQDNKTGEFVVYDKETGEEIARSIVKDDLDIYIIDPSYDPKTPASSEAVLDGN